MLLENIIVLATACNGRVNANSRVAKFCGANIPVITNNGFIRTNTAIALIYRAGQVVITKGCVGTFIFKTNVRSACVIIIAIAGARAAGSFTVEERNVYRKRQAGSF